MIFERWKREKQDTQNAIVKAGRDVTRTGVDSTERRSSVLRIDRRHPPNIARVVGEFYQERKFFHGWKVTSQDRRSLKLDSVDLSKVALISASFHIFDNNPTFAANSEFLKKMREEHPDWIPLDAAVAFELVKRPEVFPDNWKGNVLGVERQIYFDGTILRNPSGFDYLSVSLSWDKENKAVKWRAGGDAQRMPFKFSAIIIPE